MALWSCCGVEDSFSLLAWPARLGLGGVAGHMTELRIASSISMGDSLTHRRVSAIPGHVSKVNFRAGFFLWHTPIF